MKKWYVDNQPRQLERHRTRVAADRDRIRAQDTARYNRHRDKRIELVKDSGHVRRARLRENEWVRGITVRSLRKRDGDRCCYCLITMTFETVIDHKYVPTRATIEHVIPLALGGPHNWENCKLSCWQCNLRKNAKPVDEWQPE